MLSMRSGEWSRKSVADSGSEESPWRASATKPARLANRRKVPVRQDDPPSGGGRLALLQRGRHARRPRVPPTAAATRSSGATPRRDAPPEPGLPPCRPLWGCAPVTGISSMPPRSRNASRSSPAACPPRPSTTIVASSALATDMRQSGALAIDSSNTAASPSRRRTASKADVSTINAGDPARRRAHLHAQRQADPGPACWRSVPQLHASPEAAALHHPRP